MSHNDRISDSMLYVDMEVDDFATFLFKRNINNAIVELSLGGVENNKDLFLFLVDLVCKGLVLLFGEENRVELDNVTSDDFNMIRKKLSCAGINVDLMVEINDGDIPGINLYEIENIAEDTPLEQFKFKITSISYVYTLRFKLVHKVL